MRHHAGGTGLAFVLLVTLAVAQQPTARSGPVAPLGTVPRLIKYSGVAKDQNSKPLVGVVGITFAFYEDEQGGAPLWVETQNAQTDATGRYSVQLGASQSNGLPPALFISGKARWLGVQISGQAEQPRVVLLSVPYALKAEDAQTLGGLPASAFVQAAAPGSSSGTSLADTNASATPSLLGGSGTANYVALWIDNNGDLGNSAIYQGGIAGKPKIGIGTTKPASTLDVNGSGMIRGLFSLPAKGTATAAAGFNSQAMDLTASVFNSAKNVAVPQNFQWQTEAVGNNTGSATGSLNLLFAQGSGTPAETGLNIASNGQITFAKGQAFPGAGTITGVTAGSGLTGGGSSGDVTLSLNLATTDARYAQLGAANAFVGTKG